MYDCGCACVRMCVRVCRVGLCLGQDRWFVMGSRAPLVIGILPSSAPAESAYVGDGLDRGYWMVAAPSW